MTEHIPAAAGRGGLRWWAIATTAFLSLTLGVTAAQAAVSPVVTATSAPLTSVSLTFDDGNANQAAAAATMDRYGVKGTFFITTGWIGSPGYLSQNDLTVLAAAGHEIGGHTVTHPDLAATAAAETTRQVCDNRATLTSWGFSVTSFAYPFASSNTAAENIVRDCGYNTARGLGDIETRFSCAGCGFSEAIPPSDPYFTRAPDQVDSNWTLADLQKTVTNAETNGGGWVQLTFHHVCDNACDSLAVSSSIFEQFVSWLSLRNATNNTVVKTVNEAVGGTVKPVVNAPVTPAPGPGVNGIQNPSLETAGTGTVPQCWQVGGYGTNTPSFSTIAAARTGKKAEQLVMAGYVDGDAKLLPTLDLGGCSPTVTPGHTYSLRAWYTATVPTQFAVYLRGTTGVWTYWTSSPWFASSTTFTEAAWESPVIPSGATGISFGLNLFQNGTLVTDDYALYDSVGAPPVGAPVVTPGVLVSAIPKITGTARVGSVLNVDPGAWAPATTTFTYVWLRNNKVITGATASTYQLVTADVGRVIKVRVTGSAVGYLPASAVKTSAGTAKVVR